MTATSTMHQQAADALAAALPSLKHVTALGTTTRFPDELEATTASWVGETSAEFAIVLTADQDVFAVTGAASGTGRGKARSAVATLAARDLFRPAFEAAASALGAGVLGTPTIERAGDLVVDDESWIFELQIEQGVIGWFLIRRRTEVAGATVPRDLSIDNLGRITNVEMALTVEIGRTRMSVRSVLDLEPGAIIELDRSAGSPADILLNGRLIARGEIVVIDQDYAVRIVSILDDADTAN